MKTVNQILKALAKEFAKEADTVYAEYNKPAPHEEREKLIAVVRAWEMAERKVRALIK